MKFHFTWECKKISGTVTANSIADAMLKINI